MEGAQIGNPPRPIAQPPIGKSQTPGGSQHQGDGVQCHGVSPVVRDIGYPHSERSRSFEIDTVHSHTEPNDGPATEGLESPGIEDRRRAGEDHVGAGRHFEDLGTAVSRPGDQFDIAQHLPLDVEVPEPGSENRHLGSPAMHGSPSLGEAIVCPSRAP